MFIVPSVTINAGNLTEVTRAPLMKPISTVTAMPHSTARYGFMPRSTANLVITTEPRAMAMPQDRSMPAVRMIRVWPMAMMPTTITCCKIREKFWLLRKRSLCDAKNTQAASRAMTGPSCEIDGRDFMRLDLVVDGRTLGRVELIDYPHSKKGKEGGAPAAAGGRAMNAPPRRAARRHGLIYPSKRSGRRPCRGFRRRPAPCR